MKDKVSVNPHHLFEARVYFTTLKENKNE